MRETNQSGRSLGWSFGEDGHMHLPRHELPSEHLHTIEARAEPAVPAWDEPGYPDPDLHHANLPEGTPYWQGFAKSARALFPGEERPLSPGFVARITRKYFVRQPLPPEGHANRERVVRDHERDRTPQWPG